MDSCEHIKNPERNAFRVKRPRERQVFIMTEEDGQKQHPKFVVASLGAPRKGKSDGQATPSEGGVLWEDWHTRKHMHPSARPGTIAGGLRRLFSKKASVGEVTADGKDAHGQEPIHPEDWYLLCQLQLCAEVFINIVGMFDVSSASCHWSQLAAAMGGLAQHLIGSFADVFHIEAGGKPFRTALVFLFFLCEVIGGPQSWRKTQGGSISSWVGLELFLKEIALGASEKREQASRTVGRRSGRVERCERKGLRGSPGSCRGRGPRT